MMILYNNLKLTLSGLYLVSMPLAQPEAVLSGCNYHRACFMTVVSYEYRTDVTDTLQKTKHTDMCKDNSSRNKTDKCVLPDNLNPTNLATQTCDFEMCLLFVCMYIVSQGS